MQLGVGQSDAIDAQAAIQQALDHAEASLDGPANAALLFAALDYDHPVLLAEIARRHPGVCIIGGSSDGEFGSHTGFHEDSVSLMLIRDPTVEFRLGLGRGLSTNPEGVMQAALQQAIGDRGQPALVFTSPDGLAGNISGVLRGAAQVLDQGVPLIGGTTGDHWLFERCLVFCGQAVLSDAVPVLTLHGDLRSSVGVASGWTPIGSTMTVTHIEGNVLHSLDGRPAFGVFEEQFGELVRSPFGEYPLAVFEGDSFYLRAVFQVDEAAGTVILAAEIPQGATVRLTNVMHEHILDGTRASVQQAVDGWSGGQAAGAFVVSCAARKWMLGHRAGEEYDVAVESLRAAGVSGPVAGFFSFGEIAPIGERNRFHNETCVTLLLGGA
jgi:hypothetical protein